MISVIVKNRKATSYATVMRQDRQKTGRKTSGKKNRMTEAAMIAATNHVAPYVKNGTLRKSRKLSDAMIVIDKWNKGVKLILDDRERLLRLATS